MLCSAGLGVVAAVLTLSASTVVVAGGPAGPRVGGKRAVVLPRAARAAISAAIGAESPAFAARRAANGYRLDGGGVAASVERTRVAFRAGGVSVSMTVAGVGRGGRLDRPAAASVGAHANRVSLGRRGLTEWYAAGPLGIEQGFTLSRRPEGAGGPVTLALGLEGGASARRSAGTVLLTRPGRPGLTYGALSASDARGRPLRAALQLRHGRLLIRVWDSGASYPLTIDPLVQQGSKLTPMSETGLSETGDSQFGISVALSADGNTALVGGYADDDFAGAAWVFTRSGSIWTQQGPKLTGGGETAGCCGGRFGSSVALSADGSTALIGGSQDDSGAGAAWVFTRSTGTWTQQGVKLTGGGAAGSPVYFGNSVALSADGSTALVGGYGDDGTAGAVWVFNRSGGAWTQQGAKLTGGGETGNAWFGAGVALSGDGSTALIGGYDDDGGVGAAWVFARSGGVWTQQGAKLTGTGETGTGWFGISVALSGDGNTALVGGLADDAAAGAAWAFTRSAGAWTQQGSKLTGGGEGSNGWFGSSVALSTDGDTALVGGYFDGGGPGAAWVFTRSGSAWSQQGPKLTSAGVSNSFALGSSAALSADGNTALVGAPVDAGSRGSAVVFARAAGTWTQAARLTGEGVPPGGSFGESVALSADGSTALIGGPDNDDGVGAAWVFTRSGGAWTQQGPKLTGSGETSAAGFGWSVALSADGSTALIGGSGDDGGAGAAWVFTRSGGVWSQQGSKLSGAGEIGLGQFGYRVALSAAGNTALIGGNADNGELGAAWVFTRTGVAWAQQGTKLTGGGESGQADFGGAVGLSSDGNTALVTGPIDDSGTGAAWVFTRAGASWTQQGSKLTGTDVPDGGFFGWSAALSGEGSTALIGSFPDDSDDGAAWAFSRAGATWTQQGSKLTGSGEAGGSYFGWSVALSADGNSALIGGIADDGDVGAAWAFARAGGAWGQQGSKLTGGGESGSGFFGGSVAYSADASTALIGGPQDGGDVGAAWVFAAVAGATVPGPPRAVTATAGNGEATVSFAPPVFDGGAAIGSYTVTASPGGRTATGATGPVTVSGLTNGSSYTFTVTATNAAGTGPASAAGAAAGRRSRSP